MSVIPLRPRVVTTLTPEQSAERLRHEAARLEEAAKIKRILADKISPPARSAATNETPGSPTQTEGDPCESA